MSYKKVGTLYVDMFNVLHTIFYFPFHKDDVRAFFNKTSMYAIKNNIYVYAIFDNHHDDFGLKKNKYRNINIIIADQKADEKIISMISSIKKNNPQHHCVVTDDREIVMQAKKLGIITLFSKKFITAVLTPFKLSESETKGHLSREKGGVKKIERDDDVPDNNTIDSLMYKS